MNRAVEALKSLYKELALPLPAEILWFDSPVAALPRVSALWAERGRKLFQGPDPVLFHLLMKINNRTGRTGTFPDPPWRKTEQGARLLGRAKLVAQALRARDVVPPELLRGFQFDVQTSCGRDFTLREPLCMNFDAVAEPLYELRKLARNMPPALQRLGTLAGLTGWLWPFDEVAVLTAPPKECHYDERNRVHKADSPAITYPDGWCIWALEGIIVPQSAVEDPQSISEQALLNIQDLGMRRMLLQRRGEEGLQNESLKKLAAMLAWRQFRRFDKSHAPPRSKPWPESVALPVPPNRASALPPDGVYTRCYGDGQLQLVAWVEKGQMIYLRLEHGRAAGHLNMHLGGENYYDDGRMEDFSAWDDDSPPYFVEQSFEEWVRASLARFPR